MTAIPLADTAADWAPLSDALAERVRRIVEHGRFVMGPEVDELESGLAAAAGAAHAITCASGTTALLMTLMALDVRPGDEVIVPAFTFAAPAEVALLLGAVPVLVDVDLATCTIDVDAVEAALTPKTKVVIAVSLFGHPADFSGLRRVLAGAGVTLVDDAAQSWGAMRDGSRVGTLANITCTSFFPTKPLGGIGDGGAVLTTDEQLAARVRQIRDHGQTGKYVHASLGINGRLDSISCAALTLALERTSGRIARRIALADRYASQLADAANSGRLILPKRAAATTCVFAQYTVQLDERDAVQAALAADDIATAVHYPTALHHQPAFRDRVRHSGLEMSEHLARRVLSLPLFPTLREDQQDRVVDSLVRAIGTVR